MSEPPRYLGSRPGTYVLVLHASRQIRLQAGRVHMQGPAGCYYYVGSAFGPGGLRARIGHHRAISTRPHWHIDYLRRQCRAVECWYVMGSRSRPCHREHQWAQRLTEYLQPACPGFGCSDCRCATHLFYHATVLIPSPPQSGVQVRRWRFKRGPDPG